MRLCKCAVGNGCRSDRLNHFLVLIFSDIFLRLLCIISNWNYIKFCCEGMAKYSAAMMQTSTIRHVCCKKGVMEYREGKE